LARHFLDQHAARYRKPLTGFDDSAMRTLLEHRWPGNVREMDHAVERAVLMGAGGLVKAADLALRPRTDGQPSPEATGLDGGGGWGGSAGGGRGGAKTGTAGRPRGPAG